MRVGECRVVNGAEAGTVDYDAVTISRNIGTSLPEEYCPRCEIRGRKQPSNIRKVRWFFVQVNGLFSSFREWRCPQCEYMVREK
jgi:hypothetical protein